jgi:hypothetical protein
VDTDTDPAFQVNPDPDPIRIQGFDEQIKKKNTTENFSKYYFDKKLQFSYVQAKGAAFSPHKRTSSTSNEIYWLLMF